MTEVQPLLSYLREHSLIDDATQKQLAAMNQRDAVVEAIVTSGLMTVEELMHIESLFSGYPAATRSYVADPATQSGLPYEVSRRERVVCVENEDGQVCVLTDRNRIPVDHIAGLFPRKKMRIEKARTGQIDQLLDSYMATTQESLLQSIEMSAQKVRNIDSYGSSSMALFFPDDHKREIAEDLSTRKLIRSLIKLAEIKKASDIVFESHSNKVLVRMRIGGEVFDIVALPKKVEAPVVLCMLYVCDMPLLDITGPLHCTTKLLKELQHTESLPVTITPTVLGYVVSLSLSAQDPLFVATRELGLSEKDARELYRIYQQGRGLLTVTGREKSGKTFAWYQLVEAARSVGVVHSFEDQIEYVIEGVNQATWSQQKAKDIQHGYDMSDVLAVRPLPLKQALAIANSADQRLVIAETSNGIIGFIKALLAQGMRGRDVVRSCGTNVLTVAHDRIEESRKKKVRLDKDAIASIEHYLSRSEINEILLDQGLIKKDTRLEDIEWAEPAQAVGLWSKIIRGVQKIESPVATVYIRALVDVASVVEYSEKRGESLVQLEQSLKEQQKKSLLRTMIPYAFRHDISIRDIISMLRA